MIYYSWNLRTLLLFFSSQSIFTRVGQIETLKVWPKKKKNQQALEHLHWMNTTIKKTNILFDSLFLDVINAAKFILDHFFWSPNITDFTPMRNSP